MMQLAPTDLLKTDFAHSTHVLARLECLRGPLVYLSENLDRRFFD